MPTITDTNALPLIVLACLICCYLFVLGILTTIRRMAHSTLPMPILHCTAICVSVLATTTGGAWLAGVAPGALIFMLGSSLLGILTAYLMLGLLPNHVYIRLGRVEQAAMFIIATVTGGGAGAIATIVLRHSGLI